MNYFLKVWFFHFHCRVMWLEFTLFHVSYQNNFISCLLSFHFNPILLSSFITKDSSTKPLTVNHKRKKINGEICLMTRSISHEITTTIGPEDKLLNQLFNLSSICWKVILISEINILGETWLCSRRTMYGLLKTQIDKMYKQR